MIANTAIQCTVSGWHHHQRHFEAQTLGPTEPTAGAKTHSTSLGVVGSDAFKPACLNSMQWRRPAHSGFLSTEAADPLAQGAGGSNGFARRLPPRPRVEHHLHPALEPLLERFVRPHAVQKGQPVGDDCCALP